jgi:hypothetical protein
LSAIRIDDLNHGSLTTYFEQPTHEAIPQSTAILVKADQVADALNLDDKLLDELVVGPTL